MFVAVMEFVFWFCLAAVLVPLVIYPVSIAILAALRGRRHSTADAQLPRVTMIISAYNEEEVIQRKLNNTLELEYPCDRLEVIVISDCSDDNTDAIVETFGDHGVILCRQEQRRGKSHGLTQTVPVASGEILIFSDANSMYEPDAVQRLVQPFADRSIGYVVGQQRYTTERSKPASIAENFYWRMECLVKQLESRVSSVVGGDGAIYAIRAELFEPLRDDDISDFVNPLQIVSRGYRGVYEDNAVCYEETSSTFEAEFRRKVRIVNRSLRGIWRVPQTLMPWHVGWFAYQLFCHKLLRWFIPFHLIGLLFSGAVLAVTHDALIYRGTVLGACVLAGLALLRFVPVVGDGKLVSLAYYFLIVNGASMLGVARAVSGQRLSVWTPERGPAAPDATGPIAVRPSGALLLVLISAVLCGLVATVVLGFRYYPVNGILLQTAALVYWISLAVLIYVYVGYHLIVILAHRSTEGRRTANRRWPTVSLVIPAHNEEAILKKKLENALALDYPADRLEIILASDGSDDGTIEIAEAFQHRGIKLLDFVDRRGKASVVNDAVAAATGEVICLCDANVLFREDALQALIEELDDQAVGAVTGDVRLASEQSNFGMGERLYYLLEKPMQEAESGVGSLMGVDGGMYVIRRELYRPLPSDTILDDFVISMGVLQQGHHLVYEPNAVAHENGTPKAIQEYRRRVRVAAGAVQTLKRRQWPPLNKPVLLWQYLSHKLLRWFCPLWLALFFVSNAALWSSGTLYNVTLFFQILWYTISLGATVSVAFRRTRLGGIPFYFALSHVAMAIGIVKGIFNRQKVTWQQAERTTVAHGSQAAGS